MNDKYAKECHPHRFLVLNRIERHNWADRVSDCINLPQDKASGERSGFESWSDHSNTGAGQSRVPWNWGSADKTKSREGTKSDFPARLRLQYRSSPEQLAVRWGRSLLKSLRGLHPNTVATSFFTSDQARLPKGSISIGIQREKIFFFKFRNKRAGK